MTVHENLEPDTPVARALLAAEYRALKSEMLLRIAIQNLTVLGAVGLFALTATMGLVAAQHAAMLALIQGLGTLALSLQWCHQGVRQCALKQAILRADKSADRTQGWEETLPAARPSGPLGSRWFVSTKAVFIGLPGAGIAMAGPSVQPALWAAVVILFVIIAALLTNPRE